MLGRELCCASNIYEVAPSSDSQVDRYVIIRKLVYFSLNMMGNTNHYTGGLVKQRGTFLPSGCLLGV
jgi:hypothetical protein